MDNLFTPAVATALYALSSFALRCTHSRPAQRAKVTRDLPERTVSLASLRATACDVFERRARRTPFVLTGIQEQGPVYAAIYGFNIFIYRER